jgi:hypothetical protein
VFINTVDANTGYTADVAMGSFICQCANAGYTADAAMHSYICQTQDCSYSSTHFYQQTVRNEQYNQLELSKYVYSVVRVRLVLVGHYLLVIIIRSDVEAVICTQSLHPPVVYTTFLTLLYRENMTFREVPSTVRVDDITHS